MDREWTMGPIGIEPSFGFGDRIGLATAGHIRAAGRFPGIVPVFAQQSIREMDRTGRSAESVMSDAAAAMDACGWAGHCGADADHLKTPEDVDRTARAGFRMFTIDPSDHVDQQADNYGEAVLEEKLKEADAGEGWVDRYGSKTIKLGGGAVVHIDRQAARRAEVKYGRAVKAAVRLGRHIADTQGKAGREYEIELSVDETDQPTTPAEHWIIAEQCLEHGMRLVSLAPRFVGRFEKGVDYIGDAEQLKSALNVHAEIARTLGPYKLSLHSGSDKLSMYGIFAEATRGLFHVKTAGTSYLEALRAVAVEDPAFFRELCVFAREHYDRDKATYHVHARLDSAPAPDEEPDDLKLQDAYLERWESVPEGRGFISPGRQILHCTFGSVLTHAEHGPRLKACLADHADTYAEMLDIHFTRHLKALEAGLVRV